MKIEDTQLQNGHLNINGGQSDVAPQNGNMNDHDEKDKVGKDSEDKDKDKEDKDHPHETQVTVNEQPVVIPGKVASGAQIKAAAIAQGVHIMQNFILQEELPNGTSQIIGDNDPVQIRSHLRFTAIAPDDNS